MYILYYNNVCASWDCLPYMGIDYINVSYWLVPGTWEE